MKKRKVKRFVLKTILLLSVAGMLVGAFKITNTLSEWNKINVFYSDISAAVTVKENGVKAKEDSPIAVDFNKLNSLNREIQGWLFCEDTPIDYPVAYTDNNEKYVHTLPNGSTSFGGTLFVDCRTPITSDHFYIYGHCMKNNSMFGSLNEYTSQEYFDEHPVMYFVTEEGVFTCRVYSAYYANADDNSYCFGSDAMSAEEYFKFSQGKSCINTGVNFEPGSQIVTLSTCAYIDNYNRFVVHLMIERSVVNNE